MRGRPRPGLDRFTVTNLTPAPAAPVDGISSRSPSPVETWDRRGETGRTPEPNASSSASIASVIGSAARSSSALTQRGLELPEVGLPHQRIVEEVLCRVRQDDLTRLQDVPAVGDRQ